jgi:hypothetical protein
LNSSLSGTDDEHFRQGGSSRFYWRDPSFNFIRIFQIIPIIRIAISTQADAVYTSIRPTAGCRREGAIFEINEGLLSARFPVLSGVGFAVWNR